jgi:hypothetical protein
MTKKRTTDEGRAIDGAGIAIGLCNEGVFYDPEQRTSELLTCGSLLDFILDRGD